MKKAYRFLVLIPGLFLANFCFAQSLELQLSADALIPSGDFTASSDRAFGPTLLAVVDLNDNLSLTANLGYLFFQDVNTTFSVGNNAPVTLKAETRAIPLLAGFRYYANPASEVNLYLGGQAGIYEFAVDTNDPGIAGVAVKTEGQGTEFAYGPVLGVRLARLDISASYMILDGSNLLGFRAGISLLKF